MDYDGQAAFDDVLRPWLENNIPAIEQLRSLGASSGGAIPPMPGEALWFLYSVHRVLELLVLRFQTFSPGGSNEQGPAITLGEFFRFASGIGADILNPRPWSPFHHEIVGLAPTSPDMRPQGLRQHWPCLMLGPLLLMRAGVTVPAGAARLVPGIADRSMLFWAYRRNSRRHNDLAHGWGANSSWRTAFRRDYVLDGTFHFNVDGEIDLATLRPGDVDDHGLSPQERRELVVHRCFVTCDKDDAGLFPYDDRCSLKAV